MKRVLLVGVGLSIGLLSACTGLSQDQIEFCQAETFQVSNVASSLDIDIPGYDFFAGKVSISRSWLETPDGVKVCREAWRYRY